LRQEEALIMRKPIIGVTMGDPAGIGPEIAIKALQEKEFYSKARPFVIGSHEVMELARKQTDIPVVLNRIERVEQGKFTHGFIDVLDLGHIDVQQLKMGEVQKECGEASFLYVKKSAELALSGELDAIVTGPINKEALKAAGVPYIGHTEMYADLMKAEKEMTMFSIENVKIFFLTRHVSSAEACHLVNDKDFVLRGIRQAYEALQTLLQQKPKLAVAALNPHSGEGGLLGMEEIHAIRPAIEAARQEGLDVLGPVPADAVFHFARKDYYDAVLSLYHDQGHIAAKMIDFEKTVSITLGLPILRTSVDHGTAFDIAGKGVASPVSMMEAIKVAIQYSSKYGGSRF
jgi:4-phospho-D-threonate 3-dehydrogenase / 4-phospho-D-erythronate 3-dehydrogenase